MLMSVSTISTGEHSSLVMTPSNRCAAVEIFSTELDKMAAVEAGRRAGQALRNVAQSVGIELD